MKFKLARLTWTPPQYKPLHVAWDYVHDATVVHKRGKRILATHKLDEECSRCERHEDRSLAEPQRLFSYPTRPERRNDDGPEIEYGNDGTPLTPFSHRMLNSKCMEDVPRKNWR